MKKPLSYLIPILLEKIESQYSGTLELRLSNGRLILDTKHVNYSFGSLHTVMEKSLKKAFQLNSSIKSALILGYGGGSAAQILFEDYSSRIKITGVEIDSTIIEVAKSKFFYCNEIDLIHSDAWDFLHTITRDKYDLIVIDLFINESIPNFCYNPEFYSLVYAYLNKNGVVVHNTMLDSKEKSNILQSQFSFRFQKTSQLKLLDKNIVLLGCKK